MLKLKSLMAMALICCMAVCVVAQEEPAKKGKKKGQDKGPSARITKQMMAQFKKANLTDEQVKKAKEIIGKHAAKIGEAQKAVTGFLSADQKKARAAAMKAAKQEGLKGAEARKKIAEATNLSDEEQKKYSRSYGIKKI